MESIISDIHAVAKMMTMEIQLILLLLHCVASKLLLSAYNTIYRQPI